MGAEVPARLNRHGSRGGISLNTHSARGNSGTHPLHRVVLVDQHKFERLFAFGIKLENADKSVGAHRMVGVDHCEIRIAVDSLSVGRRISDDKDRSGRA
jgi:hypothetical protein